MWQISLTDEFGEAFDRLAADDQDFVLAVLEFVELNGLEEAWPIVEQVNDDLFAADVQAIGWSIIFERQIDERARAVRLIRM